MYKIDPRNNWRIAEKRLLTEKDPKTRANIEMFIKHAKAEAMAFAIGPEELISTVSPKANYTVMDDPDGPHSPTGKAEVEAYYKGLVESGMHRIEHNTTRFVADQERLITDGEIKIAFPPETLKTYGVEVSGEHEFYMYYAHTLIIWEFDENGLVVAEDTYSAGDGFKDIESRPLTSADIYDFSEELAA